MSDPTNPPAIVVRSQADVRIAKQEAIGINKRIDQGERSSLVEHRELGLRLLVVKAGVSHGEYGPVLDELGIPQQRASDAVNVAEFWTKVPERRSLHAFLKAKRANLFVEINDGTEPPIFQATPQKPGPEPEALTSNPDPGIGDAAEELPEGTLVDPEGVPLPETAKPAIEDHEALTDWCGRLHAMLKELADIKARPSNTAAFVDSTVVMKRIRAGYRMAYAQRLTPDRTYRCDGCQGTECKKCDGLGFIPETRRGDQWTKVIPPKPRPDFHRKRRSR